jgi:hypothetical protein
MKVWNLPICTKYNAYKELLYSPNHPAHFHRIDRLEYRDWEHYEYGLQGHITVVYKLPDDGGDSPPKR